MIKVYISGPMTGLPKLNFPAFHAAARSLRASGYEVTSPAEMDEAEGTTRTWAEYLKRDIKVLLDCEAIALLHGWERSKGARLEKHVAEQVGLRVIFLTLL